MFYKVYKQKVKGNILLNLSLSKCKIYLMIKGSWKFCIADGRKKIQKESAGNEKIGDNIQCPL